MKRTLQFLLLAGASTACRTRPIPVARKGPAPAPCMFSSFAKSSLAWQSGFGDTALKGRVVRVDNLRPVTFGVVRVEPSGRRAILDSTGTFRLAIPIGRYFLRVQAGGFSEAADSITLGRDGLVVLAAVGQYAGDVVVTCPTASPARQPSNER